MATQTTARNQIAPCALTIVPDTQLRQLLSWTGQREVVASGNQFRFETHRLLAIVSSHRRSRAESDWEWRAAVESALKRCSSEGLTLLACRSHPSGVFLLHAASRFGVRTVELVLPSNENRSIEDWRLQISNEIELDGPNRLWLSPMLDFHSSIVPSENDTPLVDRALISLADFVHVLHIRERGKIDRLIRQRLSSIHFPIASVAIDLTTTASPSTAAQFLSLGAVGWYRPNLALEAANGPENSLQTVTRLRDQRLHDLLAFSPIYDESVANDLHSFLTHCTRTRSGPWPDQSVSGYYDEMLVNTDEQDRPFDTLRRILELQSLLGSIHLKKSPVATVSFSEVPLGELLKRRVFQSHLHRWDWEPYGICIRRRWLEQHGCKPVIYGQATEFETIPDAERPWFQSTGVQTVDNANGPSINRWQQEREWRAIGDVRLTEIPVTEAFVFVSNYEEALRISAISRFPVMIVKSCSDPQRPSL